MATIKSKVVLTLATATFALSSAMIAPEVMAKSKKKKVKKSRSTASSRSYVSTSSNSGNAELQNQVNELRSQLNALQNQQARAVAPAPVMAAPEVRTVKDDSKDHMVFFRGGWAHSDAQRNGVSISSAVINSANGAVGPLVSGAQADKNAWYFGAGLDFSIDDNLFGLAANTEVLGEVMFQYKEFGNRIQGNALTNTNNIVTAGVAGGLAGVNPGIAGAATAPGTGGVGALLNANGAARNVTVSQFTLSASPKIKFMKGSSFRPWIIPVGFAMNVISPPSESITVLEPSLMFGAGADYKLWKNIYLGADARYQYAIGKLDQVKTDGFTVGGYLGLGF